jgi:uncharacterized protein (TIGR03905 family)
MRTIITACVLFFMGMTLNAQEQKVMDNVQQVQVSDTDDFVIVKDETVDGVRYVVATPSAKVCSKQIDIEIKDGVILKVVYTRGCEGNAKGIGALIKDMTVEEAIRRLDGINCGKRGTSCPDQLAKVLKALK